MLPCSKICERIFFCDDLRLHECSEHSEPATSILGSARKRYKAYSRYFLCKNIFLISLLKSQRSLLRLSMRILAFFFSLCAPNKGYVWRTSWVDHYYICVTITLHLCKCAWLETMQPKFAVTRSASTQHALRLFAAFRIPFNLFFILNKSAREIII